MTVKDDKNREVFKSDSYDEILSFAKKYKQENNLPFVKIYKESNILHKVIL